MSRKKKNRHSAGSAASPVPPQTGQGKRMDPTARNLLFLDLVFLAAAQLLSQRGLLSESAAGVATVLGFALLVTALYRQFKPKPRGPRK